ncbi:MAG: tRNA (guanosine(37)-N1)-methyltransferase TrmD [Acidimicrobiales bacterium]|jgi:tRNA (guanine37-N1)-methyltransferase
MRTIRIDVFTLFPGVVDHYADASILGRARVHGQLDLRTHDVRDAATDPHRSVDDAPFGGGAGMVIGPEPVFGAVEQVAGSAEGLPRPLVLLSPSGRRFDQRVAQEYASTAGFSLVCGRYEGVDQRIADHLVDEELSVGDFVLAGGELAALVVVESVVRLLPGVLGNDESVGDESFSAGLLEYPQYTRPAEFRGWEVPATLLSGDHARVDRWRRAQALVRTMERRPDLIGGRGGLSDEEVQLLIDHGEVRLLREHGYDW